jgi:RNA recognition motif-containing protein
MIDYTNLYIKNLDAEVTSYDLFKRFRVYGKIISARVMKDTITGKSKGYGFVSFTHMDEANEALAQMNGALVNTKNIVVTFHEHKKALPMTQQQQQQQQEHDFIQFGTSPPRSTTTIACYPSPQSTSYNGFIPEQQQHLVSIKVSVCVYCYYEKQTNNNMYFIAHKY